MNPFSSRSVVANLCFVFLFCAAVAIAPVSAEARAAIEVGSETMGEQTVQERIDQRMQRIEQRFGKRLKKKPKLEQKLKDRTKQQVVDQIVNQLTLLEHAKKSGISVDESEVQERVDTIKKKNPKGKSFEKALEKAGTTEKEFRKKVEDSLKIQKFVEQRTGDVSVSDEEAKQFYDKNSKRFKNRSFDKIKDRLKQMLEQRKRGQQMQKLVTNLKEKTDITVRI